VRLGDRGAFPTLEADAYLAHAAIAPVAAPVRDAVLGVLDDYARRGMGAWARWRDDREALRGELAELLGVEAPRIGLTQSTSAGLLAFAQCFPWRAGDGVVLFEGEFPANVTPWLLAAQEHGLRVRWLRAGDFAPGGPGLARLEAVVAGGDVRLVAVSAVQFQTGLAMPLQAIGEVCRARGVTLAVDAIQAAGVVPLDLRALPIDLLAGGAHKWLMGVEGAGYVYVSEDLARHLRPRVAGWLSHVDGIGFLFEGEGRLRYDRPLREAPAVLELGSQSVAGFAALRAGLAMIRGLGVAAIHAHVNAWLDAFEPQAVALGFESLRSPHPEARSGVLALRPRRGVDLPRLHAALAARGVAVTTPDGLLRVAPHGFNPLEEVPRVVAALADAAHEVRPGSGGGT